MTKSEIFKKAHKIARLTKEAAGSYRIAFAAALKDIHAGAYSASFEGMLGEIRDTLEAAGADWHLCRDFRSYVVYINAAASKLGYAKADMMVGKSIRIGSQPDAAWCRFVVWAYANRGALASKACGFRRSGVSSDVEDLLSIGGGFEAYARATRA